MPTKYSLSFASKNFAILLLMIFLWIASCQSTSFLQKNQVNKLSKESKELLLQHGLRLSQAITIVKSTELKDENRIYSLLKYQSKVALQDLILKDNGLAPRLPQSWPSHPQPGKWWDQHRFPGWYWTGRNPKGTYHYFQTVQNTSFTVYCLVLNQNESPSN